jgi:methionine aminopeptidase
VPASRARCATTAPTPRFAIDELDAKLPGYLEGAPTVHFTPGLDHAFNARMEGWLAGMRRTRARNGKGPVTRTEHGGVVHEMRLFKSAEESALLRKACAISAEAHNAALAAVRPGMMEYEIEALVNYAFRTRGARAPGYNSIVAGGENATILHYTENDMALRDGTLLLIDAGGEYEGYTADITRTFPVGRTFTTDQRAVYEIVLESQLAAISQVRPGVRFDDVHHACTARARARAGHARGPDRRARGTDRPEGPPAVLHAPHQPLARPRRPRCGPVRGSRRQVAAARARHGADRRAGPLLRRRDPRVRPALAGDRRADRGRHPGDGDGPREPERRARSRTPPRSNAPAPAARPLCRSRSRIYVSK